VPSLQIFLSPPNSQNAPAIVPPHGSVLGATATLTDDELLNVKNGTKFYYIYGTVKYYDIFDDTPMHTTTFCRQVTNILGHVHKPNTERVEMFFSIVFPKAQHSRLDRVLMVIFQNFMRLSARATAPRASMERVGGCARSPETCRKPHLPVRYGRSHPIRGYAAP
jgi:hypothetical protein